MGKKPMKESTKQKLKAKKKEMKQARAKMRARLIVRNLPFNTTKESLKKHFEPFGEVLEVKLLIKDDGKLIGCGFVQFKQVQKASKAKYHLNGKEFLGRSIMCDFAMAKDKYIQNKVTIKEEPTEVVVKQENEDEDDVKKDVHAKEDEDDLKKDVQVDVTERKNIDEKLDVDDDDNASDVSESSSSSVDTSDLSVQENPVVEEPTEKKKQFSNDVVEGKTVFVKNLPFTATNVDLKECMLQFGPVYYALICVDKFTEHSKGTGFVKFVNKEDAEKCLAAGTELTLLGNILDCHRALGRNDLQKMSDDKNSSKTEPKDSRNLYLVKEGVILAGSKAAEGVSASDMAKRLQLEQYKTQMLRKLNMFVSRERLIVHNLPPNWDNTKLRALFIKYAGKNAVIKEARIMRDLKNVDSKGIGVSKEYGFVSFTKHENALIALRALNNNPNIFSVTKRPIVSFSIENRSMINAKLKRLQHSQIKNPKNKKYDPKSIKKVINKETNEDLNEYSGITATPGNKNMRSKFKLKKQAQLHHQNLKEQKRKQKNVKKTFEEKKNDFIRQPKQKINKKKNKDHDNFSKLVNDYKKKLISAPASNKRSKWYES